MHEKEQENSEMQRRIIDVQEKYASPPEASAAEDETRSAFAEAIVGALETGTHVEKVTALTALLKAVESKVQKEGTIVAAYVSDHHHHNK